MTDDPTLGLASVERTPLSLMVSRQLRDRIVSGEIPVGTELPSEKDLTQALGVSRATLREGLRILQAQGLITGFDRVSTQRPRVTDEHVVGSATLAMQMVLQMGRVSLDELVELRVVIEGAALERAAEVRDAPALEAAHQALAEMTAVADLDAESFSRADIAFHYALVRASGNAAYPIVMTALRQTIHTHLEDALLERSDRPQAMSTIISEHKEILEAVERGWRKRARELVSNHISGFYGGLPK